MYGNLAVDNYSKFTNIILLFHSIFFYIALQHKNLSQISHKIILFLTKKMISETLFWKSWKCYNQKYYYFVEIVSNYIIFFK